MSYLGNVAEYIIPFLIVLTILVFIHELGHYLVARYNGVKIEVFSIGFGPELFGWNDKSGTRWKFSAIPLGGYVRMYGDADGSSRADHDSLSQMESEDYKLTLHGKTVGQRMAVVAAGPIANFLLAIVLIAGIFVFKGQPSLPPVIGGIVSGKISEKIGLKENDKIISLNGETISEFMELREKIQKNAGKDISLLIERKKDGKLETLTFSTKLEEKDEKTGEIKPINYLGIRPGLPIYTPLSPLSALTNSVSMTYKMSVDTLYNLGQMIVGKKSSEELGGILAIGDMAAQSAKGGIFALLMFMAMLSINLGLINLLPIPVLDGGHLLFYGIEAIRGKPVSPKAQEYAFMVGLAIVLGTMLLSTWNDVSRYKLFSWLGF
jgi:regulator of sigma E protease